MLKQEFVDNLHPQLGGLADALLTDPVVSVRYNCAKAPVPANLTDEVPWCPDGRYLAHRPAFTQDPALHQGLYYVQDASSMAIYAAVKDVLPLLGNAPKVLDACAAPGGKTTAALSALPAEATVVANEYDFRRAEILAENVAKWGSPNTLISRGDTSKFRKLIDTFDLIIVDAPCSGEGMMRKDEQARQQWSLALVDKCATLQREILENAWEALRPGGVLIYSTCTFNREENERNAQWLIDTYDAESLKLPTLEACQPAVAPGIETPAYCYRFLPGRIRGEGLFMAAVRKPGSAATSSPKEKPTKIKELKASETKDLSKWIKGDFKFYAFGDDIFALPALLADFMLYAASKTDVLSMGVWVATVKGRELAPAHPLALSTALRAEAFAQCQVDYPTAIAYLQRQAVTIDAPKGFVLLMHEGHPLGFVKNLGNRSNNLYPKNWRIRN